MNSLNRMLLCVAAALFFWLGDSLLFCLMKDCAFIQALFPAVPSGRLLVRLIVAVFLLLFGIMGFIGHTVRLAELTRINRADDGALFGDEKSSSKSRRLLYHSMRLATMMGMSTANKDKLRILCYCYDIGMVCVPSSVLSKNGPLEPEEQRLRDAHTDWGAKIVSEIPQLRKASKLIAAHEELYDGNGPHALYGRSIPLACRIFVVAMIYDYYTQPHQEGDVLTRRQALDEMMLYRGTMLDPDVFDAFVKLMNDDTLSQQIGNSVYVPK